MTRDAGPGPHRPRPSVSSPCQAQSGASENACRGTARSVSAGDGSIRTSCQGRECAGWTHPKAPVQWMLGRARPLLQDPGELPVALKDPKQPGSPARAPHSSHTGPLCPPGVRLRPRARRSFRVECCPRSVWPRSVRLAPLVTAAAPDGGFHCGLAGSPCVHTCWAPPTSHAHSSWGCADLCGSLLGGSPSAPLGLLAPRSPWCRGEGWQGESSQIRVRWALRQERGAQSRRLSLGSPPRAG